MIFENIHFFSSSLHIFFYFGVFAIITYGFFNYIVKLIVLIEPS